MAHLDAALKGTARIECLGPLKINTIELLPDSVSLTCSFDGYRFNINLTPHETRHLYDALSLHHHYPHVRTYPVPPETEIPLTPKSNPK